MPKRILLGAVGGVLIATSALAQVPPLYQIVTIADWPPYCNGARMNNRGQIVFMGWYDTSDRRTEEILLYDRGQLLRLTDDYIQDVLPDINDDGTIVWSRGLGPPDPEDGEPYLQVVMWRDGVLTQLTNSSYDEGVRAINNLGHVVWSRWKGEGLAGSSADIYFYDGLTIHQITNDDWSNQGPALNDDDWIAWTQYDFSQNPWDSRIALYADGVVSLVSPPGSFEPQVPSIDNLGRVAWYSRAPVTHESLVEVWQNGAVSTLTDRGGGPLLNDRGDITFWRWHSLPYGGYEVWLYRDGEFNQITVPVGDISSVPTDANAGGEVAISSGRPWLGQLAVKCMRLRIGQAIPQGAGNVANIRPVPP